MYTIVHSGTNKKKVLCRRVRSWSIVMHDTVSTHQRESSLSSNTNRTDPYLSSRSRANPLSSNTNRTEPYLSSLSSNTNRTEPYLSTLTIIRQNEISIRSSHRCGGPSNSRSGRSPQSASSKASMQPMPGQHQPRISVRISHRGCQVWCLHRGRRFVH